MSAAGTGSLRTSPAPVPAGRARGRVPERAEATPSRAAEATLGRIREIGAIAALALACARALARPNRRRLLEVVRQSANILRAAPPSAVLSIAAWGFAGPGLQAGNFLVTFGSIDRSGGFMVVAILREVGTYVTATVVGGVAGKSFT